jgi:hypothetical protein
VSIEPDTRMQAGHVTYSTNPYRHGPRRSGDRPHGLVDALRVEVGHLLLGDLPETVTIDHPDGLGAGSVTALLQH